MNLIVNVDLDWGIGRDGRLLVRLSEDMKRFRQLTTGQTIVLGRKTLETFPNTRPLPDRTNIVLTRDQHFKAECAQICHNLAELAICLADIPTESVFITGGDSLYHQLLPFCHKAYVTRVHRHFLADTFFPNLDRNPAWKMIEAGPVQTGISRLGDPNDALSFQFCLYRQDQPTDLLQWVRERGELFDEES
ncbi:MAG: dihydrofolate reductase [Bacillota bacterium]|nr:dihydrofolate reductase [Bacillota bacterium]